MRILEIVLLLLVTVLPFIKRPVLKFIKKKLLIIGILSVFVLHLILEGWRWQMIPIYVLLVIVIWRLSMVTEQSSHKLTLKRGLGYFILLLLLLPSWALPNILPVFNLPTPTGNYQVGTHVLHVKTDMEEPITKAPNDKRELAVKVWYPTSNTSTSQQEPYLDEANRTSFITKYGGGLLPPSTMDYLDRVNTHVYRDATIAAEAFPVLLFSHGYGSNASGYYAMLTEIASHGYIIINMNHTYESLGATFPDGSVKLFDYDFQGSDGANAMQYITPIQEAFAKDLSYEERHAILREASKEYNVTHMVKRWAKDMSFVMDQLEGWNERGFLKDRLDLEKIGVFGHSRGGGAAGQVALKDARIKAAANIDGVQWGEMMDTIYSQPFLYISADWPAEHPDINAHVYKHKSTDFFYRSKLLTAGHPNFMDIPFMIPVPSLAQTGTIDAELGIAITNQLVISFFNKHLKMDATTDPTTVSDAYELLEMKVYKGGVESP